MEVGILSMRYAKAIIEYAQEKGLEDRLYQEFLTLSHSFCEQPGLREALDNPVITTKEKLALVCTAADGDGKSTREFVRFITLVLRNRREGYLQFISLMYLDLYRKLKHIGVGQMCIRDREWVSSLQPFPSIRKRKTGFVPQQSISCTPRWNSKR